MRWLKKDATFLDKPRYAPQLRRPDHKYDTLLANINARYGDNLLDELGHAIPALETLQRLAKACASIGNQLGLSPGSERAMSHAGGINPDSPWLALANRKYDEEVVPASAQPAARPPAPEPAANGTPQIPGFTSPA